MGMYYCIFVDLCMYVCLYKVYDSMLIWILKNNMFSKKFGVHGKLNNAENYFMKPKTWDLREL